MAFQSMLSGADCSVGSTPLAQLLKHSDRDTSLQQDRLVGPSQGTSAGLRTRGPTAVDAQQQAFFERARADGASPLAMEQMRREIDAMRAEQGSSSANWADGFAQGHFAEPSAEELASMEAAFRMQGASPADISNWQQAFLGQQPPPATSTMNGASYSRAPMGRSMYGGYSGGYGGMMNGGFRSNFATQPPVASTDKGKGRFVELDDAAWEAEFAKATSKDGEPIAAAPASFQDKADEDVLQEGLDKADEELMSSLESTWRDLHEGLNQQSASDAEMAAWEKQFGAPFADPDGTAMDPPFDVSDLDELLKHPDNYHFDEQNSHDDDADPFAQGMALLASGAQLSEASLAFEAACRKEPQRAEAWRALGETLAADEKEVKAISALERACALSLDHPGHGAETAWLSLAISYVNEGQEMRSLAVLERWLSITYPDAVKGPDVILDPTNPWSRHERVIDLFLRAARSGPNARLRERPGDADAIVDADVQVGLGVLFYGNSDYVRARDCFEAALSVRPEDFLLWNRLGATMANGGSPEEAIHAYRRALELRPTFTRAIYNLGVSCLNVSCYQEAAEHLLAALDLHRTGKGSGVPSEGNSDGSENLWSTLRRAFLAMDRTDLAQRAKPGTDVTSFRADGFDF